MGEYIGYDSDEDDGLMGEEYMAGVDDDEILGAVRSRRARAPQQQRALPARPPGIATQQKPPARLRGYLGLGSVTFAAAAATAQSLSVEPQRAFRPERLVIVRKDSSAAAAALLTTVTSVFVGDQPQSPSVAQGAPTEMFAPDVTVSGVDFNVAKPGVQIQLNLAISAAPAGADTVILACGMYGVMVRQ